MGRACEPFARSSSEVLPALRAGHALDGTLDPLRDPAPVVAAGLRRRLLVAHPGFVHFGRIERDVIADRFESGRRIAVRPGDRMDRADSVVEVVVARRALPLAE